MAMRLRNVEVVITSTVKANNVGTLKQEPGFYGLSGSILVARLIWIL